MREIRDWNDMRAFGINLLTGEACAYSMRGLCDVSESGKDYIESFFGGNVQIREGSNWNSGFNDGNGNHLDSIGSVMLPYGILQELAAFCLLSVYGGTVYISDRFGVVLIKDDEEIPDYARKHLVEDCRRFRNWNSGPNVGGRNVHAMSGRVS